MRIDQVELEQRARRQRAEFVGNLIADAIAGIVQWLRKAARARGRDAAMIK